ARTVVGGMFDDPLDPGPLLSAPTTDAALTLIAQLVRWLASTGLQIVTIVLAATLLCFLAGCFLPRFVLTMVQSGAQSTSATVTVIRRDPKAQRAAQARSEQRASTLSNVARNIAHVMIWAIATMMILSEIGVNIAPVIASLGVVGLAA